KKPWQINARVLNFADSECATIRSTCLRTAFSVRV
ncbi:MAG: hypothetical protein ACI9Y8_000814, partial [Candidatus Omnitrophota bacterium]